MHDQLFACPTGRMPPLWKPATGATGRHALVCTLWLEPSGWHGLAGTVWLARSGQSTATGLHRSPTIRKTPRSLDLLLACPERVAAQTPASARCAQGTPSRPCRLKAPRGLVLNDAVDLWPRARVEPAQSQRRANAGPDRGRRAGAGRVTPRKTPRALQVQPTLPPSRLRTGPGARTSYARGVGA